MSRVLLVLLFVSVGFFSFGQGCNENEAVRLFTQAQEREDADAAKLFEKAADGFRCCKLYDNYLIAAYQAGAAYYNIGNLAKGREILEKSIQDTRGLVDTTSEVSMLIFHTLGELHYGLNEPDRSVYYYKKAASIMGDADSEALAVCLFNLGNSYATLMQHDAALRSHLRSIGMKERLSVATDDDYYQAYSALGDIYQAVGKADSSDYYYKKAANYADVSNLESVAYLKFKEAQKSYGAGSRQGARASFEEVKNLCEVAGLKNDIYVGSCFYLGLLYEADENAVKAKAFLSKALEYQKDKNDTYYNILLAYGRLESADNKQDALKKWSEVEAESKNLELENQARIEMAKVYENDNLEQAERIYNQVISSVDNQKYPVIYAQAVCGLGNINSAKNQSDKALAEYRRAMKAVSKIDAELEANIHELMGNEYFKNNKIDSATRSYQAAYDILSAQFGDASVRTLSARENIASAYMAAEDFKRAVDIYAYSLSVKSAAMGEQNVQLIDLYANYANALYNLHDYDNAGANYEKCLRIIENDNIPESRLDVFYNNYGLYCKATGDYKKALAYTTKSLDVKQKNYGTDNAKYANTLNNLGTIYDRLGNFNKSAECFDTSEDILVKVSGESSQAVSDVYINKGNLYNRLGQYELALVYYNKALAIKTEQNSAADRKLAPIYNNVGTVYQNLEDYRPAQFYFQKSLDITRKYDGEKSLEVAEAYNNLGNVYLKTGKTHEAIGSYLKASNIYGGIKSVSPVLVGNTNNNIATAYLQTNQLDSAQFYYYRSVDLYKNVFGDKHPYLALIYNNIGNIDLKQGKYDEAILNYSLAIESNHDRFNSKKDSLPEAAGYYDQSVFVNSLLLRASAYTIKYTQSANIADLTYAFNHYQLCDNIVAVMRHSALTKNDKLELGKIASKCYEGAMEVCMQLLYKDLSAAKKRYYQEQSFLFAEKGKANSLLESMVGQDAMQLANIPYDLQQKENRLSADVLYFEQMLAEKPKNSAQVRDSLLAANKKHEDFVKQLEKDFPEYHQLKYADNTIGLGELQKKMKQDVMMLMYVLGDERVYVMSITNNSFNIDANNTNNNLADSIKLYRNTMLQTSQKAMMEYCNISRRLCTMLLPQSISEGIRNLVIIPDGALNQIPYESLLLSTVSGSIYDYSSYDFLIKKYAVSYAYSATLYYRDITREKNNGTEGWLGMAPVFTTGKYSGVLLDSRIKKNERNYTDIEVNNNGKLEPLASSETEVRSIFTMFQKSGQPAKACLWGCASRQNFNADSVSRYRYIHLATHGFVNSEKPELSGVQLSSLKNDSQGGILYSGDVYGLKLKCDLLILSACETGLGKIMKGEGIVGLSRAFIYAGSKNLLVSLWKVADNSTSQMMVAFYKLMLDKDNANLNYAELLQKAKLLLISEKNYARPYYWAPFIVIGD
ncbi:MAG: tetratricopeptide repeat protein [Salinivirgaceae bacterium]|nr:tetratricopeptide repeat protein [Salinivirgaceae bacterium]